MVFWSYHMPVLVARRKCVKFSLSLLPNRWSSFRFDPIHFGEFCSPYERAATSSASCVEVPAKLRQTTQ